MTCYRRSNVLKLDIHTVVKYGDDIVKFSTIYCTKIAADLKRPYGTKYVYKKKYNY